MAVRPTIRSPCYRTRAEDGAGLVTVEMAAPETAGRHRAREWESAGTGRWPAARCVSPRRRRVSGMWRRRLLRSTHISPLRSPHVAMPESACGSAWTRCRRRAFWPASTALRSPPGHAVAGVSPFPHTPCCAREWRAGQGSPHPSAMRACATGCIAARASPPAPACGASRDPVSRSSSSATRAARPGPASSRTPFAARSRRRPGTVEPCSERGFKPSGSA